MLSHLLGVEEDDTRSPSRTVADDAISMHAASVASIFSTLASKLPRYRHFVEIGQELRGAMAKAIQLYNQDRPIQRKAVTIAIADPLGPEVRRIFAMLEYAGIVRNGQTVSRGVKGVFHRYTVHYAILIEANALSLGRSFSVADVVRALTARDAHAFVRTQASRLLGADYEKRCILDLAPCQNCGAPRVSEDAQFCMRCGKELANVSVYDELLKAPIERLPLTTKKLKGLRNHTSIRTVQDILLDQESAQIRSVPHIGPVWAARIRRHAEEFVSV
jgi:hypothetical protein